MPHPLTASFNTAAASRALLQASKVLALHKSLSELLRELAHHLHTVVPFDYLALVLHDAAADCMRLTILEPDDAPPPPYSSLPVAAGGPAARVWQSQKPSVVPIPSEGRLPPALEYIRRLGQHVSCWLPLTTAHGRHGVLCFASSRTDDYPEETISFMVQVAAHVAVAVDNAINFDRARRLHEDVTAERNRLELLLGVTNALVSDLEYPAMLKAISESLRTVIAHDAVSLAIYDSKSAELQFCLGYDEKRGSRTPDAPVPLSNSPAKAAFTGGTPLLFTRADLDRFDPATTAVLAGADVQSLCCLPLITRHGTLGTLNVSSCEVGAFPPPDVDLLARAGVQIALALDAAIAYHEVFDRSARLAEERRYLAQEILTEHQFGDIIGRSPQIARVLKAAKTVAETDATVLLLGETGTGKELIARAIHHLSPRCDHTFVRLSAAALPANLLESELFGYERGAFTGATSTRIGRIELANRGTLFLDEIGDMAPELQPKLLRILQEREFERLGSTLTRRVDVRVIAATNRPLDRMVEDGTFRQDLYYRLNVFPIVIPPLRERPEDIPRLVRYFTARAARRLRRPVPDIPKPVMDALTRWSWPGNIRELENVIERAVILSDGRELHVPVQDFQPRPARPAPLSSTLQDINRATILKALREARGIVGGPGGAAARLGLKRTTLQSLMRRLGISRPSY